MADNSVPNIIGVIKRLDIVDENYKDVINHLLPLYGALNVDDIEKNVELILPHSECKKITGRQDLPFLTLTEEERNTILNGFVSTDNDLKLRSLFYFKFGSKLNKMFEAIKTCIEQDIPYKNENNLVYDELFNNDALSIIGQTNEISSINQSIPFDYEIDRRNRR
ncbi:MAG: hypothetical protein IKX00_01315 [Bacilli bacterium]|nr:hypothetical protein [Bacilli bacterium]